MQTYDIINTTSDCRKMQNFKNLNLFLAAFPIMTLRWAAPRDGAEWDLLLSRPGIHQRCWVLKNSSFFLQRGIGTITVPKDNIAHHRFSGDMLVSGIVKWEPVFWGDQTRSKSVAILRDFPLILLMAEILHHLGCIKPREITGYLPLVQDLFHQQ